ncbi:ankyrin repeat protein [Bradyrhizobium sp. LB8.2]|uniref:ankyrin repeat domain-containing protein n=1 Tax=Bradyrhizobium sp. LB8.2 TaxID=3156330 RepID=UPI003396E671
MKPIQRGPAEQSAKQPPDRPGFRTAVIVAAIGLAGVLGAALINNWVSITAPTKVDRPKSAEATSINQGANSVNTSNNNNSTVNQGANSTNNSNNSNSTVTNITNTEKVMAPKAMSLTACLPQLALLPPEMRDSLEESALKDPNSLAIALQTSTMNGNVACVQGLLQAGAPPNGRGRPMGERTREMTPLVAAIQARSLDVMKVLIAGGANPNLNANALDGSPGDSPVAVASLISVDAVRLLLANGANANSPNKGGDSALHIAVRSGDAEMVRELMRHGARVDAKADNGRTPLDYAKESHAELLPILTAK